MERSKADIYLDQQQAANAALADRAAREDSSALRTWGWITTLLLWPVGLVLAIVLVAKGDRKHGGWMLAICVAWAAVAAVLTVGAMSKTGGATADQLQVDLPRAISDASGDTFTNVTCVHERDNVYECVGDYRMSKRNARAELEGLGEQVAAEYAELYATQQSGAVAFRVIVGDDGAMTWRPV